LTPRAPSDYASPPLLLAPVAAALLTVVIAVGRLVAPDPTDPSWITAPAHAYLAGTVGALVIAAVVRLAIRTVVARRQPTGPPDIVEADDAIRASAVHHLAGGGTAAILLIAAQLAYMAIGRYEQHSGLALAIGLLLAFGAFVSWRWYAYRHWRVRRVASVDSLAP
ncbi:MAG: hypothetical protein ABL966_14730, partial [Acidimicrobiales bacterium]